MIAFLSNAVANTEAKLKNAVQKRKNMEKECILFSNEIQNKTVVEITQLKKENDGLLKKIQI